MKGIICGECGDSKVSIGQAGTDCLESPHTESYTAIIKNMINDDWEYQEMKKTKKENSYFQNTGKYKRGKR